MQRRQFTQSLVAASTGLSGQPSFPRWGLQDPMDSKTVLVGCSLRHGPLWPAWLANSPAGSDAGPVQATRGIHGRGTKLRPWTTAMTPLFEENVRKMIADAKSPWR